jgi:hypothetical protein
MTSGALASWRGTAVVSVVNGFVRCLNTVSIQANASLFVIIFNAASAFAQLSHHKVTPAAGYWPQKRVLQ